LEDEELFPLQNINSLHAIRGVLMEQIANQNKQ